MLACLILGMLDLSHAPVMKQVPSTSKDWYPTAERLWDVCVMTDCVTPLNGLPFDKFQQPFESPLFIFLASKSKPGCQKKTQRKQEDLRPVNTAPSC